jgi:hypothetical protein
MVDRTQVLNKNARRILADDPSGDAALELFEAIVQMQGHELGLPREVVYGLATLGTIQPSDKPPLTYEAAVKRALKLKTLEDIHKVLNMAVFFDQLRSKRGPIAARRQQAIKILIYTKFLQIKWREAADRVCSCSQRPHGPTSTCLDSLKQTAKKLTALLRQYGVDLDRERGRI